MLNYADCGPSELRIRKHKSSDSGVDLEFRRFYETSAQGGFEILTYSKFKLSPMPLKESYDEIRQLAQFEIASQRALDNMEYIF